MKIIVCGPRGWNDYETCKKELDSRITQDDTVLTGDAPGTDWMACIYSRQVLGKEPFIGEADWKRYGDLAGPIRNNALARMADKCIAFQPLGNVTKGTQDMIKKCRMLDVPVEIVRYMPQGGERCY